MNLLKQARVDHNWTQTRVIAAIQSEAHALGQAVPGQASLRTQLSRWENGHKVPDGFYRRVFERIYRMSPSQLGFEAGDNIGLEVGTSWTDCADRTADLWSQDMERRNFLQTAIFSASAFAAPALAAVITDRAENVARIASTRVLTHADVTLFRDLTRSFAALDNRHGGGQVRRLALACLTEEVSPLLRSATFSDAVGKELLTATAELTQLVGWMSHDVGRHSLAQRYLIQALGLARSAGDTALVSELLCAMSQQSTYLADAQAVGLAQAARSVAARRGNRALVAEAHVMEAHAHARAGSGAACATALHAAELTLDQADRSSDPDWISYFDEAYVAAKFGHCFRELGDHNNAIRFAERSLEMDSNYVRGRAFNLTLLAHAQADSGDMSSACATGHRAVDLVTNLQSDRAIGYLRDFRSALAPASQSPEVKALDDRLVPLLAA